MVATRLRISRDPRKWNLEISYLEQVSVIELYQVLILLRLIMQVRSGLVIPNLKHLEYSMLNYSIVVRFTEAGDTIFRL